MTTIDYSKMTPAQMLEAIKLLQQANDRMTQERTSKVTWKISQRGGISVYGLGRFPVTLHPSQWDTLFTTQESFKAFLEASRKICDAQSTTWKALAEEAKAKGMTDAKAEDWIKGKLREAKNPYVAIAKEEAAAE